MGIIFTLLAVEFYNNFDKNLKENNTEVFIVILVDACNKVEIFDILIQLSFQKSWNLHMFQSLLYVY